MTTIELIKKDVVKIDSLLKEKLVLSKVRYSILRKQNDGSQSTGAVDTSAGEPDVVTASKMATISHTVAHTGGTGSANEDANGTAKGYLPPLYIVNFIIKY